MVSATPPLFSRLCALQGRSGRVRKISPPPARSESLYRLSYPGPHHCLNRIVTVTGGYKFAVLYMIRPSSATTYSTALFVVLSNQLAVTLDGLRHVLF